MMPLAIIGCLFIYAVLIYPIQVKERIIHKVLDTYKYELEHGVPESKSQMKALLDELGESNERKDGRN